MGKLKEVIGALSEGLNQIQMMVSQNGPPSNNGSGAQNTFTPGSDAKMQQATETPIKGLTQKGPSSTSSTPGTQEPSSSPKKLGMS